MDQYAIWRAKEPNHVLPTSAWKVDNSREIKDSEMRISVRRIHMETTGFKQIAIECNHNLKAMESRIFDIIHKRGKLHNPITNTGGVLFGVVDEVGERYACGHEIAPGDEVICNASMAGIPLFLSKITKIEHAYSQIDAEGYAIIASGCPIVKRPEKIPINLLLFAFDESATLMDVSRHAEGQNSFLIIGNNMFTNLIFGSAIRMKTGKNAKIICLLDQNTNSVLKGRHAKKLLNDTFDETHVVNILRPIECIKELSIRDSFDIVINCADIPGAETINVIAARHGGMVYFTNLINNHYLAAYVAESSAKEIEIKCAQGFLDGYDQFNIGLFQWMGEAVRQIELTDAPMEDQLNQDREREEFLVGVNAKLHDRSDILGDFICESIAMQKVIDQVFSVAKYDCNVLITGETGVGKEKVAALIHKNSGRNMQPFVKISCAAISENLIESELFGYEKGSFTGANAAGKKGYFELADNGIIFLDEVGELPMDLQAKLLRAIQEGEFYRVGGVKPIRTNIRIISATNKDLIDAISKKTFRSDLYYRLNVFPIRVPGLQERRSEIPALVKHFVKKYNKKFGMSKSIMRDAMEYLRERRWPGNIRELENVVQRLMIGAKREVITTFDVMRELNADFFPVRQEYSIGSEDENMDMEKMVRDFEREIIRYALEKHGSTRKAAKAIGISQTQIVRKKRTYGI